MAATKMTPTKFRSIAAGALALASAAFLMIPASVSATAGQDCQAGPFVSSAALALMHAANSGTANAFSSAVARFTDIDSIALSALGPYRAKLPKARQTEYLRRTRAYIGRFLADNSERFKADGLTISSCKNSGSILLVDSRLSSGQHIIWRVSGNGNYRIEDVSVQKVWLAQQLRSNFVYKIRSNDQSVDALIDQLG